MYSRKNWLRKTWLDKCLKAVFQRTVRKTTRQMSQHTVPLWRAAPLQYLLITVKVLAFEKSLLVIQKILRLFVNTLTLNDKYYILNRDNLPQPIQMQLSETQKTFSEFLFEFWKSILNFKHLPKKDDPQSLCIPRNTGSEKYG